MAAERRMEVCGKGDGVGPGSEATMRNRIDTTQVVNTLKDSSVPCAIPSAIRLAPDSTSARLKNSRNERMMQEKAVRDGAASLSAVSVHAATQHGPAPRERK